jgi:RNA polymerase sigma factor (TIGR02999 family)
MTDSARATMLLRRLGTGDPEAAAALLPLIQDELHAIASRLMDGERRDHTLQPTALMHEAWLRLIDANAHDWENRAHFLRIAARSMRNVLVDHARGKRRDKRGGGRLQVTLDEGLAEAMAPSLDMLALDEALERLAALDPQLVGIVELKFFAGLTDAEVAQSLGIALRTAQRGWRTARAWLAKALGGGEGR